MRGVGTSSAVSADISASFWLVATKVTDDVVQNHHRDQFELHPVHGSHSLLFNPRLFLYTGPRLHVGLFLVAVIAITESAKISRVFTNSQASVVAALRTPTVL